MRAFEVIYVIGKYLALPGSYLRAFWEHLACRLFMVPVNEVNYLSADENCSHVEHDFPNNAARAFLISFGPGFMNFITGIPLFLSGVISVFTLGLTISDSAARFIVFALFAYFGASMLCNCFPSVEDALFFWEKLMSGESSVLSKIVLFIPAVLMLAGSYLEKYSVTVLLYLAAGVAMAVFTFI